MIRRPTLLGLFIALIGLPIAAAILHTVFTHHSEPLIPKITLGLLVEWLLFITLIIIIRAEKLTLSSIGVKPFKLRDLSLGLCFGILLFILFAIILTLLPKFGLSITKSQAQAKILMASPFLLRLAIVITAGVVEETFYRGYAIERLGQIFGNIRLGALLTLIAFTAVHAISWGLAQLIPISIAAAALTLIYLWRRNLILNIIAHIVTDGIAFLLLPLLHH